MQNGNPEHYEVNLLDVLHRSQFSKGLLLYKLRTEFREHIMAQPHFHTKRLDELWGYATNFERAQAESPATNAKAAETQLPSSPPLTLGYTPSSYRGSRGRMSGRGYGRGSGRTQTRGSAGRCYLCNKPGHFARDCPDRMRANLARICMFDYYNADQFDVLQPPKQLTGEECDLCGGPDHEEKHCYLIGMVRDFNMSVQDLVQEEWHGGSMAHAQGRPDREHAHVGHFRVTETKDTGVTCDLG